MDEDDITDFSYRLENTHINKGRGERYSTSMDPGAMNKLQQRVYIRYEEANEKFIRELTEDISAKNTCFNTEDIRILLEYTKLLPLINYKSSVSYYSGYIVAKDIGTAKLTMYDLDRIIRANSMIRITPSSSKSEIVKYYRFWTQLLYSSSIERQIQKQTPITEYTNLIDDISDSEADLLLD